MKRILTIAIVFILALTAMGFAQRVVNQGRMPLMKPQLSVVTPKANFTQTEAVTFTLRSNGAPATLQGCYFTVEKMVGPDNWMEFYRSAQNPFDQAFMGANTEQNFSWGQSNTAGTQMAGPGTYRVRVFSPAFTTGSLAAAGFNILAGGGGTSGGQDAVLEMKLMRYKLVLGETAAFRLQNIGGATANLDGHHYVIQGLSGNRWIDYFTSSVNALGIRSLDPGQIYKFIWTQKDRSGRLAYRGDWRIVFFAPNVGNSPVSAEFNIR